MSKPQKQSQTPWARARRNRDPGESKGDRRLALRREDWHKMTTRPHDSKDPSAYHRPGSVK
jgi:hypothetical protein